MNTSLSIIQWILPLVFIAGGLLIGLIFEKIILKKLKKIAVSTKWEGAITIINSLRGKIIIWSSIAGMYGAILNIPMNPALLANLQKILLAVVVLSATMVIANVAGGFVKLYIQKEEVPLPSTSIFINLTKLLIFLIGIMMLLQTLGISITPVLTALGVGGLAAALALQPTLANLFSGLQIIAAKQLRPGDYVKLDTGEEGYVTDVTWRNTTIRALPNNMIIVPNSKLASTIVTNFHQPKREMSVLIQVGVSYDSDLQKVEKVTIEVGKEVMREVEGGVPEFEPFIRYHTFDDSSINFTVILRTKEYVGQYLVKHEFVKRLHERYNGEGIVIPFPIRTVLMKEEKM